MESGDICGWRAPGFRLCYIRATCWSYAIFDVDPDDVIPTVSNNTLKFGTAGAAGGSGGVAGQAGTTNFGF